LVADLARAPAEDIEAVLADLEPAHRARVQALIVDYLGGTPKPARPVTTPRRNYAKVAGLSPWLVERLDGGEPAGRLGGLRRKTSGQPQGGAFAMTPTALDALRRCAAAVPMQESQRGLFAGFGKRSSRRDDPFLFARRTEL
jgi:hypothetical protein